MKIADILPILDAISSFELAESWDNCGLIVGNYDDEFEKIYCSIDLDEEFLDMCDANSLIITHHPLIFKPLHRINFDTFASKLLGMVIKKDIKLIAMHSNFDKTHLNRHVMETILGFPIMKKNDFVLYASVNMKFDQLVDFVCKKLDLEFEKFVVTHEFVRTIALCTGSGGSLLQKIEADTYLTGDIKYHEAMEAKILGLNLIDIGHYESEVFFAQLLHDELRQKLKTNNLQDIITASKNPFTYRRKR